MKKKIIISVILLMCLFSVAFIVTYAKYVSSANGNTNLSVAKWAIKVNNTSIVGEEENSFDISFNWNDSQYVVDSYIAPGMTGTATIEIDPKDSQVALDYWISISSLNTNPNFTISSVTIAGVALSREPSMICVGQLEQTDESSCLLNDGSWESNPSEKAGAYKGEILLPTSGAMTTADKITATINITWTDLGTSEGNLDDTSYGIIAGTKSVPITVFVEQKPVY